MKKVTLISIFIVTSLCVFAQQKKKYFTDEYGNPMHYDFGNSWAKTSLLMLVDGAAKKVDVPGKYDVNSSIGFNVVYLEGAKWIELESIVNQDSLKNLRYTILVNDSIYVAKNLIPKNIKYKWGKQSSFPNHVTIDLGRINIENKKVDIRVTRLKQPYNAESRLVVYSKPIKAAKLLLFRVLKKVDKNETKVTSLKNGDTIINDASTLGIDLAIQNTDINYIYEVLISNKSTHGSYRSFIDWKFDGKNKAIVNYDAQNFKNPGNYEITITPRIGSASDRKNWGDNDKTVKLKFTVVKSDEKTFKVKELINFGVIIGAIFGGFFVGVLNYIKRKNAKKLKLEQQQKEVSKTQLNSIRAQLNPHFMFNALAGIQNLMNKNKVDEANRYLNKFARLTRNVLDQKEVVSLGEEKELLEDYLQMEKLRFEFAYEINIDSDLNINNIEIPAMLLQPFVENAVKHGLENATLGRIEVLFEKKNQDLIIKITDNGEGFEVNKEYNGLGLQLSKNRISLLNTIYTETPFILDVNSTTFGTTISITLSQWL